MRALLPVLRMLWLEGWAIGHTAAASLLADEDAAWAWAEGDSAAAAGILSEDVLADAEAWVRDSTTWAGKVAAGRQRSLARVLVEGLLAGLTARQLAQRIGRYLTDRVWARTTALTELTRASSAATARTYRHAGIATVTWVAEIDNRTCPNCLGNEAYGPVPLGALFPDGSTTPPAHPSCRCHLAPVEATATQPARATGEEDS